MNLPAMGARGQGWVWGQFALIAAVIIVSAVGPAWPWTWMRLVGLVVALAGGAFGTWALFSLGDALTPFPKPRSRGSLIRTGPYAIVRHPIYSALLLAMLGITFTGSPWGMVPLLVLVGWWLAKSTVEERYLRDHYEDYEDYSRAVRYRLIPFVV